MESNQEDILEYINDQLASGYSVECQGRSQWRPQPAVWGSIHSPNAMGASARRMSMRARRSTICAST